MKKQTLKEWLQECIKGYHQRYDEIDKNQCLDTENYVKNKQLFWQLGFLEGSIIAMQRIERHLDEFENIS